MTAPVLSVLIPTHDRPQFLREAIGSILGDGFADFEIIISDDSSTGSAAEVVAAFHDSRLRYFANPAPGTKAGNWDYAARQARGRYCFKLDDDDRILPGLLSRCVAILENEPDVASVYTAYRVLIFGGEKLERTETVIDDIFFGAMGRVSGTAYARAVLANEGGYPRNQKTAGMFRRDCAERLDFFRLASEDFAFSAALGLFGRVAYVSEVLYEWRIHSGSGVRNLEKTYRLSDESCEGLLRLPGGIIPESERDGWERLVRTVRRALPLFYLEEAFGANRATGLEFWRYLKRENIPAPGAAITLCYLAGICLPNRLFRLLREAYQRSTWLQRAVRILVNQR